VLEALLEAGAEELRFADLLPASIEDRAPRAGDEDLVMLACRRITFEWVLRRAVLEQEGVRFRGAAGVLGLCVEPSPTPPRIRGLKLREGPAGAAEELAADLVVDAAGRRSRLPRWLEEAGLPRAREEREPCGIFYCSRFFRLRPGVVPPESETTIGADLGYIKYAIFHGDSAIFSVTLAASPEDAPLRAVLRTAPFEAACAALPAIAAWTGRAEPISDVHGMASLHNTRRIYVDETGPVASGLVAIGDAAVHSNPLYGRGCTLGLVHAWLLADAVAEYGAASAALAGAVEAASEREIVPWYELSRGQDREASAVARRYALGEEPSEPSSGAGPVDPRAWMRSLIRHGLIPALRHDADVARAFFRSFNCLVPPSDLMKDPALLQRILAFHQTRDQRDEPRLGPTRTRMLEHLAVGGRSLHSAVLRTPE
jgi:2-polyprenyl-6-methoxyphenol hydroxylase-like FAD-dependent oxidoreductase